MNVFSLIVAEIKKNRNIIVNIFLIIQNTYSFITKQKIGIRKKFLFLISSHFLIKTQLLIKL